MVARFLSPVMGGLLGLAFASSARAGAGIDGPTAAPGELDHAAACVCVHLTRLDGPVLSTAMQAELTRIWRLNGVDVRYSAASNPQACAAPSALHVTLLLVDGDGTRQGARALHASASARAVAVLHAATGLARVYVFVDRARQLLDGRKGDSRAYDTFALSLLVARLAAHEIGHVLLRSSSHTREGLMRAVYDSSDGWAQPDGAYTLRARDRTTARRNLREAAAERVALGAEPGWPR